MSNSNQNTKLFVIIQTTILLVIMGCVTGKNNNDFDIPKEIVINVPVKAAEFKDSLLKEGIDTLIVFSKECSKCISTPYIGNKGKMLSGSEYSVSAFVLPTYIFWIKRGNYFVKRIDQFAEYNPIKRPAQNHLPLYDYIIENKKAIQNENYNFGYVDTLLVSNIIYSNHKDTVLRRIIIEYYHPENKIIIPINSPFTNGCKLEFYIANTNFEKSISDDYFTPIATEEFKYSTFKEFQNINSSDSLIIGNDEENYKLNNGMKIYILKLMIESELFDIEMRDLWKPISAH